jgi:hypothetical protein
LAGMTGDFSTWAGLPNLHPVKIIIFKKGNIKNYMNFIIKRICTLLLLLSFMEHKKECSKPVKMERPLIVQITFMATQITGFG